MTRPALLALIVFGTIAASCGACAKEIVRIATSHSATRTPEQAFAATVQIRIDCQFIDEPTPVDPTGSGAGLDSDDGDDDDLPTAADGSGSGSAADHWYVGSGVIVSPDRVLTNVHMVTCEEGKRAALEIRVGENDPWLPATPEVLLPAADIARVRVAGDLSKYFTPIEAGPFPEMGERICSATAYPQWSWRCAETQPTPSHATIMTSQFIQFGNSGSGTYVNGRLVGVVRATQICQSDIPCMGAVAPLQGYEWLVP